MRGAWGLVAALALLGGCLGPVQPAATLSGEPVEREAYLSPEMTLVDLPTPDARAVRTGSFFQAWAEGADYPTWLRDPLPHDVLVEDVRATVVVQVTGPVTRTMRFPDLMVYGGSGEAWMAIGTVQTPPVLVPGQAYPLEVEVAGPEGGLWVPAGVAFGLKVVPVMTQDPQRDVEILVGGPDASRATWRETPVAPALPPLVAGEAAGEVVGSAYAGAAAPPTTSHRTPVRLSEGGALLAWMNTTASEGIPDVDLSLLAPDGSVVASSGTPTPREALRVAAPNLPGEGEYALVVTSYGSARAAFTLEWRAG